MSRQNENLEKLLEGHQRRLHKLKAQQALQGIETPPSILLEIEDIEATIKELQAELEESKRGEGKEPAIGPDIVHRIAGIEAKIDALQKDLEALKQVEANTFPSGSLPQINVSPGISLTPQERTLLQHIFEGFSQVLVQKEFGGGYSGTRVLWTLPSAADGTPAAAKVTKLGWTLELRRERDNYQLVKNFLPFCVAPIVGYYEQVDQAALNYEWVGGGALGRVIDLEEYYRSHTVEQIVKTLTDLLDRELGRRWYSRSTPLRHLLAAEYGPRMIEHLRLKLHPASADEIWPASHPPAKIAAYRPLDLETLRQEREVIPPDTLVSIEGLVVTRLRAGLVKLQDPGGEGVVIRVELDGMTLRLQTGDRVGVRGRVVYNRRSRMAQIIQQIFPGLGIEGESIALPGIVGAYPNPLKLYSQVLGETVEGKSYVHGDLHPRNVLVDESGKGWLIDFAKVEKRHNLFDFIKLEIYLRLMELAGNDLTFSLDEYVKFEEALNNATLGQNSAPPANPPLKKAYEVILAIRYRIAQKYMGPEPDFRKQYFPALFLYGLVVTKYYQEQNPRPTRLIFTTGAVLAHYIKSWSPVVSVEPPIQSMTQHRRVEAGVPSHAKIGDTIDLIVQVYLLDSPSLRSEDWPTKQKPSSINQTSESVALKFSRDHQTGNVESVSLKIRVEVSDFTISGSPEQLVEVPPNQDSKRIYFLLTPTRAGSCRVNITVHSADGIYLGTIPLETAVGEGTTTPVRTIASLVLVVVVEPNQAAIPISINKLLSPTNTTANWPPTLPWHEPYYPLPDRDRELTGMVEALSKKEERWGVFVSGLGGIGKTALAVEIGRRCMAAGAFERVLGDSAKLEFLASGRIAPAEARATLNFEGFLNELGTQLDRPDLRVMPLAEKRRVLQNLLSQTPYLVIIDNLETVDNAEQTVRQLPSLLGRSRLLITSREVVSNTAIPLILEGLSEADSLRFLRQEAEARHCEEINRAPDNLLREIQQAVGGQPLALKLIVGQAVNIELDYVLKNVRKRHENFYQFIYWDSWQKLSLLAQKVLIYLGKFPASVSLRQLLLYKPFGIKADDELTAALEQLINLSLVNVIPAAGGRRYAIHELTRQFVNSDLPKLWKQA